MHIHYIYNILLFLIYPLFGKRILYVILVTYPILLMTLPDTGSDFSFYQRAYETVYFNLDAPLFFRSSEIYTAEPGWFLYMGIVSYFISDFRLFLVFNFLISTVLIYKSLLLSGLKKDLSVLMITVMVPVQFVIIMFWSPRSALPLALCFYGLAGLVNGRIVVPILIFSTALMIHSQYAAVIAAAICFFFIKDYVIPRFSIFISIFISGVLILVLLFSVQYIVIFLDFLPSADIIQRKIHYLDNTYTPFFRVTGLLSLILYPLFVFFFKNSKELQKPMDLIIFLAFFSFFINLIFLNNAHVAGRLSRAPDYFLFPLTLSLSVMMLDRRYGAWLLVPFFLIFPFMISSAYKYETILNALFG